MPKNFSRLRREQWGSRRQFIVSCLPLPPVEQRRQAFQILLVIKLDH